MNNRNFMQLYTWFLILNNCKNIIPRIKIWIENFFKIRKKNKEWNLCILYLFDTKILNTWRTRTHFGLRSFFSTTDEESQDRLAATRVRHA